MEEVKGGTIIIAKKAKDGWVSKMTEAPEFKEGALRKYFGLKEGEVITLPMIEKELKALKKKYPEGGYSTSDLTLLHRLNAAKNMIGFKVESSTETAAYTETPRNKQEAIDLLNNLMAFFKMQGASPDLAKLAEDLIIQVKKIPVKMNRS